MQRNPQLDAHLHLLWEFDTSIITRPIFTDTDAYRYLKSGFSRSEYIIGLDIGPKGSSIYRGNIL